MKEHQIYEKVYSNVDNYVKILLVFFLICIISFLYLLYHSISMVQEIDEPQITTDMYARLDEYNVENDILELRGWGFCEDIDTKVYELKVVLYAPNTNSYFLVPSTMEKRDDVQAYFKEISEKKGKDYSYSGFYGQLKIDKLPHTDDVYEVCVGWGGTLIILCIQDNIL